MRPNLKPKTIRWWLLLLASLGLALQAGALCGCGAQSQGPPESAGVSQVIDGDTLVLKDGARVRLEGIDAPEMEKEGRPAEFLAHKSKAVLNDLTRGQELRLEYDVLRYDHYSRLLAYLFRGDGAFINAEMVRLGLAHVYPHPPNLRYQETLLAAQREAMEARRGVWQKALVQDEPYYLANRSTLRFHRPECPLASQMAPGNRLHLERLQDAFLQGFSPCRSCKP